MSRTVLVAAMFGVLLIGCGTDQDLGGDGPASQLERDHVGLAGLMDFFETHTENEIREMLAPYDIGYTTYALISDCPQYFPSSDRNVWHSFNGEFYYIEGSGRPHRAYA